MERIGRRVFIALAPLAALNAGALLAAEEGEENVTPAEDLMREHGVLKRVLLVYDEICRRVAKNESFPADAVTAAAEIIRNFIEQYHEKLEEEHLFPRFRAKKKLVDLVDTLEMQHKAGRRLTEEILTLAKSGAKTSTEQEKLAHAMSQFVRMYSPHEAREDTVLFPAIHEIVSKHEYAALGEEFEKKEHQLFGKEGFEGMVERIAGIEKHLGIFDLNLFTPR